MPERPRIIGKTKRGKTLPKSTRPKNDITVSDTQKFFDDLNLVYAPQIVFADNCRHLQNISIDDLPFYHEDPDKYDQLSEKYGHLIGRSYVAPGVIKFISHEVGYGYFATEGVSKDEFVGEYTGLIQYRNEVENSAYAWSYPKGGDFQESLPEKISLNAAIYGNEMRFVNHSDRPSLRTERVFHGGNWHVVFIAKRDIQAGEEFRVSYGQRYWRKRKKLSW
ncbi:MAG: SET domain-containing protein-lysine N-methyltransferase [Bacteroidota bacterium]